MIDGHKNRNLTTVQHWEDVSQKAPQMRLPSGLDVGTRNLQRLMSRYVGRGMNVLEIGCAPGKFLAWMAAALEAKVSGLDYSRTGIAYASELFEKLRITADLRCEDAFDNSFPESSFDVVCSFGVIEHFSDPSRIVAVHMRLLKDGGRAIITVPNYGGFYRCIQNYFDAENLAIHNTGIMNPISLRQLIPKDEAKDVSAFHYGRFSPWLIHFGARWPRLPSRMICLLLNGLGLLQPFDIAALSPLIVLVVSKEER